MRNSDTTAMSRISEVPSSEEARQEAIVSSHSVSPLWQEEKDLWMMPTTGTFASSAEVKPWYVVPESNPFRKVWNVVLVFLLGYTGTIFPYRLCFVNSNIDGTQSDSGFWRAVEWTVDILFYIDLVVWFVFTYRELDTGKENFNISCIIRNYLRTFFWLNLVACIPAELVTFIIEPVFGSNDSNSGVNKVTRLTRLQRASRMVAKAAEFARLFKVIGIFRCSHFALWRWLQKWRYMRIVNFVCGLFWVVHVVACGWYLVASFHEDKFVTWVARRDVLDSPPFNQWVHANYFILTVFTTVGFGDIYAFTVGEIFYVSFAMIIGTIVQSTIMGEVINIVSSADQRTLDIRAQKVLLKSFTDHVRLEDTLSRELMLYVESNRSHRHQFKRDEVRALLTSNVLPRDLLELLASGLFDGELVKNKFITTCLGYQGKVPPRFPLLLAVMLNERHYVAEELVYLSEDYPWTLFLVIKGTFAYVAFPSSHGGVAVPPRELEEKIRVMSTTKSGLSKSRTSNGKSKEFHQNSCSSGTDSNPLERHETKSLSTELFAYQLFGTATYFGDLELMLSGVKSRLSSARCECDKGQVLELQREDLTKLMKDFRTFGQAWRSKARRREDQRKFLLWRLQQKSRRTKDGSKLENFAASCIQRYWRFRHGQNFDRQKFFLRAFQEPRTELRDSLVGDDQNFAELAEDVAKIKETVASMQDSLQQKVGSMERSIADLTNQISCMTKLLLEHLGTELPKPISPELANSTISSV